MASAIIDITPETPDTIDITHETPAEGNDKDEMDEQIPPMHFIEGKVKGRDLPNNTFYHRFEPDERYWIKDERFIAMAKRGALNSQSFTALMAVIIEGKHVRFYGDKGGSDPYLRSTLNCNKALGIILEKEITNIGLSKTPTCDISALVRKYCIEKVGKKQTIWVAERWAHVEHEYPGGTQRFFHDWDWPTKTRPMSQEINKPIEGFVQGMFDPKTRTLFTTNPFYIYTFCNKYK